MNGPSLILDKSALQALSERELFPLFAYYFVVIPPILVLEILGDLKKEPREEGLKRLDVSWLAGKLLKADSLTSVPYEYLCAGSLLGQEPSLRKPNVGGAREVVGPNGMKGLFLDEQPERGALRNWEYGNFTEAERLLAGQWRSSTRALDLEGFKKFFRKTSPAMTFPKTLEETKKQVRAVLEMDDMQVQIEHLNSIMDQVRIPGIRRRQVYDRWFACNKPKLQVFAPYASYCLEAYHIFLQALLANLIPSTPTVRLDLEYLFYAPFCRVFVSSDQFHIKVAPIVLERDQTFGDGREFKQDLGGIADRWDEMGDEGRAQEYKEYGSYPPENPESFTWQAWQKHIGPRKKREPEKELSKEAEEALLELVKSITQAAESSRRRD